MGIQLGPRGHAGGGALKRIDRGNDLKLVEPKKPLARLAQVAFPVYFPNQSPQSASESQEGDPDENGQERDLGDASWPVEPLADASLAAVEGVGQNA